MKIEKVEVFHVKAGWRPWTFVKISTSEGICGWSECTDSHGSPKGIEGTINDLSDLILSQNPLQINKILCLLHARTKQSPGSIVQKSIAAIENALWDIKGKSLNLPLNQVLGGAIHNEIDLYWSHCGTSRVRAADLIEKPQIKNLNDLESFANEIITSGYRSIKTNIAVLDDEAYVYMPGFAKSSEWPILDISQKIIKDADRWISGLRNFLGDKINIALDLNFNFKPEGYIKIAREIEKHNLSWLEIDSYDPETLNYIKNAIKIPITSCENLYGLRQYKPFFDARSMHTVSVDVIWNGLTESIKIANLAEINEMNVTAHNFNGHLSTFISMHFCSLINNLKIAEVDVDDVPWKDELFSFKPTINEGKFIFNNQSGWGCELNEKILAKYRLI